MRLRLSDELEAITERIIGAAFEVSRTLGHGFAESVYKNALRHELALAGLKAAEEVRFEIRYRDQAVGTYIADLIVADRVVVELKAVEKLAPPHVGQVLNYLKAGRLPVGLLLNFGTPRLEIRRVLP
ncbi:GxxExxY protein [Magnetospirillum sp. 15-1]|uniref:GxxExxY protein n=1 Tax=Magnetospirillum sp. 15-1 TaxID=1979370 RepID=UPI000BBC72A5|nr:GxxExxY protein [Magnetospirillum sp. 15-1]